MVCEDFERFVVDFLDGSLAQEKSSQMNDHAMACPRCRALLSELSGTVAACRSVPAPEFPEAEWRARREEVVGDAVRFFRFRSIATTLASVAVLAVGLVTARNALDRTSPPSGWEASLSPDAIVEAVEYLSADSDFPVEYILPR